MCCAAAAGCRWNTRSRASARRTGSTAEGATSARSGNSASATPGWMTRPSTRSEVTMFRVTKEIHFCYGHRLLNYAGKCRNLHGHNGRADIVLEGTELDDRGMVVDFTDVKRNLARWIDDH